MDSHHIITCPSCGHQFSPEKAISDKIREEFLAKYKQSLAAKEKEWQQKLEAQQQTIEAAAKQKAKEEYEAALKHQTQELEEKRKQIFELKNKELDLLKKEQLLAEQKQTLELELQKKLLAEKQQIEEAARKKAEEEQLLKLKEKDLKLEQLMQQLEVMKKKAEQGSMQAQGEVQELVLEELLTQAFPFDTIQEVGKGVKGADVIQTVRSRTGAVCGNIIYESKRTQAWSNDWIEKLKTDLRGQKSDIAVIVTQTMPKDMERFGQKEGVWVCTFAEVKGVAAVLRESLIRIHEIKSAQENKGDKMQMLYDFLTGNEFRQQMEAIVEGFTEMQNGLAKERAQMEKIWREREKQIEKVLLNTGGMWGSIKGIAGNAISDIKLLELGE